MYRFSRIPLSVLINSLESGGTERHLLGVLPRLVEAGFVVNLFPIRPGGSLTSAFVDRGVRVVEANRGYVESLVRFTAHVRRTRPLVHCFLPEAYLLGSGIAMMCRASACIMSRRSRNHYQNRRPLAACLEKRLHRRMDALLGNSRAVVQDLLNEGAPAERVQLIYNGIDVGRFLTGSAKSARRHSLRAELGISDDQVVLTCVANLFPYKGHIDLLNALGHHSAASVMQATLLLVGRNAGAQAKLATQAARLGLAGSVRFLGERDDVANLLAASDIGVLASHEEGFSNAVLEGMAASLPMVVTDVGGNAEAVIDGECGYVVPAHTPAALAHALGNLIGDADRRQAMGAAARRRVASCFSLDACVAAYQALYEELWERRSHASHRP